MICHCGSEMTAHGDENPFKVGAHHCDACGCCLLEDGTPREGHGPCAAHVPSSGGGAVSSASAAPTTEPEHRDSRDLAHEAAQETAHELAETPKPRTRRRKS